MKNPGVYTITNLVNGKIYVGSSTTTCKARMLDHYGSLRRGKHNNVYLQRAFDKYGEENLVFEVLEECSPDIAGNMEDYWINLLESYRRELGYNLQRMSGTLKGTRKSPEACKKQTKFVLQYDLEGNFIQEWETIKSACEKYNIPSSNISMCVKGVKPSCKGYMWRYKTENYPIKIKPFSEQRVNQSKAVLQYDLNDNFIAEFSSVQEAAKLSNTAPGTIINWCKNIKINVGKYKWKYKI